MSLVNVGIQLAQAGRRVLLVDFDLEAPGLPTFNLSKPEGDASGVVEYVTQYITTGESPDVAKYIYKSEQFERGGLWVMPAGLQNSTYSQRLNSIDWRKLYGEQSGYLFFEDLKVQWKNTLAPDYVLIDSRTGHSDVEGVCTRQLPDAVCLLFFPNEQNLQGLKRIVSNIRSYRIDSTTKPISLHFAVSNVPDLDDEDHILSSTLQRFSEELGYINLSSEIHHYNSLSLLTQEIFSLNRPNSRLTTEYRKLTTAIRSRNNEDRDAVLAFLKDAHRDISDTLNSIGPRELLKRINLIQDNFGQDGEVCYFLARLQEQIGSSKDALSLLSSEAVQNGYATGSMFAARAGINHKLGNIDDAIEDLRSMLDSTNIDLESFLETAPIIDQVAPDLYSSLPTSKAFLSLTAKDRLFFVTQSEGNKNQLRANAEILKHLRKYPEDAIDTESGVASDSYLAHELALASIGAGDFAAAADLLRSEGVPEETLAIADAFNLAMATWGMDRQPSIEHFKTVAQIEDREGTLSNDPSINYLQCMAIAYTILGNVEKAKSCILRARESMRRIPQRVFSAWSYSKVGPKEFFSHLDQIDAMLEGKNVVPVFMEVK